MIALGGALGQANAGAQQLVANGVAQLEHLKWSLLESFLPEIVGTIADTTEGVHSLVDAFAPPPVMYTLTLGTTGTGSGTVSANPSALSSSYIAGTTVTVMESPSPNSMFTGWSGAASGTATSVQITMNTNESVTATFNLSTNSPWAGTWNGSWSSSFGGGCTYNDGGSIGMTISVAAGGSLSGTSTADGIQCISTDGTCTLQSTGSASGSVSGSATTTTITAEFDMTDASCNGDSFTINFSGTLTGNNINWTLTEPGSGTLSFTKQ
jgi:hypothetical protein